MGIWLQNPAPRKPIQPQKQQSQRTQQLTNSDQRGTDQEPLVVKELPTPKTEAEAARDAEDRKEKAMNDREIIGLTRDLAVATVILAVIGLFQLFVFGDQAKQLRRTVRAAGEQSEAMERSIREATRLAAAMENVARDMAVSAQASIESVAILRDRTARQIRAYVCVIFGVGIYQEKAKGLKFEGKPVMLNTGSTPAHKVTYSAQAAILAAPLPEDFPFPIPAVAGSAAAILGPQQRANMSAVVPDFCDDAEVENIKHGAGKALYVWGIVTYEDVFGDAHHTKFAQAITWLPDNNIWSYYMTRHNEAT